MLTVFISMLVGLGLGILVFWDAHISEDRELDIGLGAIAGVFLGALIGCFIWTIGVSYAPKETYDIIETREITPITENTYYLRDGYDYIVRQDDQLTLIHNDSVEIEKADHTAINYFYEERSIKSPYSIFFGKETQKTLRGIVIEIKEEE